MAGESTQQHIDAARDKVTGGDFSGALSELEHALALNPESLDALILQGVAYAQSGNPAGAEQAFRKATEVAPTSSKAWFNYAVHLSRVGQKTEAERAARQTLAIDPAHPGAAEMLREFGVPVVQSPPTISNEQPSLHSQSPPVNTPFGTQPGPNYGGYYRPEYQERVHSLAFVERLGRRWDTIGFCIAIPLLALQIWNFVVMIPLINEFAQRPQSIEQILGASAASSVGGAVGEVLFWVLMFLSFLWMIFDLADRRGNWLWILPYLIMCCCGLTGLLQIIYQLWGRER